MGAEQSTLFADVLVVCGQGTYQAGSFYAEFPDRDVYLRHALQVAPLVSQLRYTHVVCSGGLTQAETPDLSEARSMLSIWEEFRAWPLQRDHVFLDELALDSAENLYLGLMAARLGLGPAAPLRRIGLFSAWNFKKPRFNDLARELGILPRFYFHGCASESEAHMGANALEGERREWQAISANRDYLLLSEGRNAKRKGRFQGSAYDERLTGVREGFPRFFAVVEAIRRVGMTDVLRAELQKAFAAEVVKAYEEERRERR